MMLKKLNVRKGIDILLVILLLVGCAVIYFQHLRINSLFARVEDLKLAQGECIASVNELSMMLEKKSWEISALSSMINFLSEEYEKLYAKYRECCRWNM